MYIYRHIYRYIYIWIIQIFSLHVAINVNVPYISPANKSSGFCLLYTFCRSSSVSSRCLLPYTYLLPDAFRSAFHLSSALCLPYTFCLSSSLKILPGLDPRELWSRCGKMVRWLKSQSMSWLKSQCTMSMSASALILIVWVWVWVLQLLVYEALSYYYMKPASSGVWALKLLVYETLSWSLLLKSQSRSSGYCVY